MLRMISVFLMHFRFLFELTELWGIMLDRILLDVHPELPRILIVDDDIDVIQSLVDVLEIENSCHVESATNSSSLAQLLKRFRPDIAILDIKVGNENGLDYIPILRRSNPKMCCIMMTAYRDVNYAIDALRAGANEFLLKPIDPDKFLSLIDSVVDMQREEVDKENTNQLNQTILNQTPGLIFILSAKGACLEASQSAVLLAGMTRKDIIGMLFSEIIPWASKSDNALSEFNDVLRIVAKGELVGIEAHTKDSDGKESWYEFSFKPIMDDNGSVSLIIVEGHDCTKFKRVETHLTQLANKDALTGLPNRKSLDEFLMKVISHARFQKSGAAVLFVDLDGFKHINDTLGHAKGDEVLISVSQAIKKCLRGDDIVARIGGDEFVVVMQSVRDSAKVKTAAQRILTTIHQVTEMDGGESISASIGVSLYPIHAETPSQLIRNSDEAMYIAKRNGKNQYHVFNTSEVIRMLK